MGRDNQMKRHLARLAAVALMAALLFSLSSASPELAHADGISLQLVAGGLSKPVGIVNAGDGSGRLFIVEQDGLIRIWDGTQILDTEFLNISDRVTHCCNEQGLLGLAFHPNYEDPASRYFYVNYVNPAQETIIARYQVPTTTPNVANESSELVLMRVPRPRTNHNGGQLAFGPDGYLYVGMGDSGSGGDPDEYAENIDTLYGKLWRLDVDAASPYIPPSNPLVGVSGRDEIWAYGLRNPWRFAFDRLTGDLFIADVGQGSREEIDFQPASDTTLRNYGWDIMEGTACFEPPSGCNMAGKVLPIVEYDHSTGDCSVTGGFRHHGPSGALWGTYIFGDYCSGRIWGATFNGTSWSRTELVNSPHLISSFGEDETGEVYVAHHGSNGSGAIYRLVPLADVDSDGLPNANDNCPNASNAGQQDADGDALGDACEASFGTNAGDADTDNDGCNDGREARPLTFDPVQGGRRDPLNVWDFFDVTGDRAIDLADTLDVLQFFGQDGTSPQGNLRDRNTPSLTEPWRTAEDDGGIDLQDALVNLKSFGHGCS